MTPLSTAIHASASSSIPQSSLVATPSSTIAIQLMPAPAPHLDWYGNPTIIVPALTFLGVMITVVLGVWKTNKELNTSQNKWKVDRDDAREKVEKDRNHAAEEARKARLTTARREVYLELIKEMTTASMSLGGMAFREGEEIDIQAGFQGFISAAARVGILGDMRTVVKSRELMNMVTKLLYKKLPEAMELKALKSAQKKHQEAKNAQLERSADLRKVMTEVAHGSDFSDIHMWMEALESSDAIVRQLSAEIVEFAEGYLTLAKRYQRSILPDTAEIAQKTNELIECIRTELELATDPEVLKSTTKEMYADAAESVASMQNGIES